MVRTQIQLPNRLYSQIKEVCRQREWSLAEAMRRAAEHLVETYPPLAEPVTEWQLPAGRPLGAFLAQAEEWRELANS